MGMVIVHFLLVMLNPAQAEASAFLVILDGRPATLFMILAGIGASLMAHSRGAAVHALFIKRGLFLFIVGYVNLVLWQGDILRIYGLSFLLAPVLVRRSPLGLALIIIGILIAFALAFLTLDYGQNWDWETMTYRGLWTLSGSFRNLFFDGFRSVLPWTSLFLIGMLLGRLDLRSRRVQWILLFTGAGTWVLAEASSRLLSRSFLADPLVIGDPDLIEAIPYLFGTGSMPPLLLFLLSSGGMALLVLGLCLIAAARFSRSRILAAGAATGRLAFRWYLGHIYVGVFTLVALDFTTERESTALQIALVWCLAMALVSYRWRCNPRHGLKG